MEYCGTLTEGSGEEATYEELFALADSIFHTGIPDDSTTASFTVADENVCLQLALDILNGGIYR